jgi:hypothetical protein
MKRDAIAFLASSRYKRGLLGAEYTLMRRKESYHLEVGTIKILTFKNSESGKKSQLIESKASFFIIIFKKRITDPNNKKVGIKKFQTSITLNNLHIPNS